VAVGQPTNLESPGGDVLDRELLQQACAGDEGAFLALYRRHQPLILAACRRWSRDRLVAEELAQDVFVKAFCNLQAIRESTSLRPWLLTVARNLCIDHIRAARPREVSLDHAPHLGRADDTTSEHAIAELTVARLWARVYPALRELDARDLRLLWQRDVEGRSYGELALAEGETKHALRNRAFRARTIIRERFRALTDELEALSILPPAAFIHRVAKRIRMRVARLSQALGDVAVSLASAGCCFIVVTAIGIAYHRAELGSGRFGDTAKSLPALKTARLAIENGLGSRSDAQRHGPARGVTRSLISAHVNTTQRPGTATPHRVSGDFKIGLPIEEYSVGNEFEITCFGEPSKVLPLTGIFNDYC
jgi:RNA polymerase sigma-70 factor (ECF subfamily)